VPLQQATAAQLTEQLHEREASIQTLKGLFRAQFAGPIIPLAQRMEGAVYYRRPEALRLQGFDHLGGKVFEFSQNRTHYRLDLPSEGKRFAGSLEDLRRAKIGRLFQLSRWAVSGVVGGELAEGGVRTTLAEDGDRYRLDLVQPAPAGRVLRRLWFDRRSLRVVQDERFQDNGEVDATITFDDYRGLPAAIPEGHEGRTRATWMPFKVTIVDRVTSSSMVLTFHEIVVNPVLLPEELGFAVQSRKDSHAHSGG